MRFINSKGDALDLSNKTIREMLTNYPDLKQINVPTFPGFGQDCYFREGD